MAREGDFSTGSSAVDVSLLHLLLCGLTHGAVRFPLQLFVWLENLYFSGYIPSYDAVGTRAKTAGPRLLTAGVLCRKSCVPELIADGFNQ